MGKFADFDDVNGRYEGVIPDDRTGWIDLRVGDVEAELLGLVPSLAADIATIDAARATRVRRLVVDKVLGLYRNPDGALTTTNTMGSVSESRTLPGSRVQSGSWVSFTDAELAAVRQSVRRRPRFGSIQVSPWGVPR